MKRFLSFFIIFAMFISLAAFSVSAVDTTVDDDTSGTGTSQNGTFWQMIVQNHIAGHETVLDSIIQYVAGKACGQICSVSSDGLHHCNGFDIVTKDRDGNKCYRAICTECSEYFYCYDGDFNDAYDNALNYSLSSNDSSLYVKLIGYQSGKPIFKICGFENICPYTVTNIYGSSLSVTSDGEYVYYTATISPDDTSYYPFNNENLNIESFNTIYCNLPFESDKYILQMYLNSCSNSGSNYTYEYGFYWISNLLRVSSNTTVDAYSSHITTSDYKASFSDHFGIYNGNAKYKGQTLNACVHYCLIPVSSYDITEFVSPSGNNYFDIQITNEDNSVTVQNIKFVDETNNLFYDPVTNNWVSYVSYDYNFEDRSYTFYLDSGDTSVITYGDEYVSYVTGGDTYNYYYYTTIINEDGGDDSTNEDDSGEDDNGDILSWLKKIYNAVRGIDTGNDIDVTINNITNGEEDTDSFFKTFKLKLQWIRDVYEIAQMLLGGAAAQADAAYAYAAAVSEAESGEGSSDSVSNLATGAPSIYLNLGNANSHYGYDYGGSCVAIDFSWFAAYKPTVDSITGGFLWLLYLWGLVKNVPSIINGMGMTENRMSGMVAKFLDDDRK